MIPPEVTPQQVLQSVATKLQDFINTLPVSARNAVSAQVNAELQFLEKALTPAKKDA